MALPRRSPQWWFVVATWLLATLIALRFVCVFGLNFPFWDDFGHVPYLTHERPVTLEWLWAPHNEHRLPIAKLFWLATSGLSNGNYKLQMFLSVLILSAGAAGFLWALACKRGSVLYSDAVVPLLLLSLAQWENLTWGHQVPFVVSAMLPLTFVTVALRWPHRVHVQGLVAAACWGWGMSVAMFLGVAGVLFAWRAWRHRDESRAYRTACAVWCVVLTALFASYVLTFHVAPHHDGPRTVPLLLDYATRLFGDALSADEAAWPIPSIATAVLVILAVIAFVRQPKTRDLEGVMTLLAFVALTGATITFGRTPLGIDQAFAPRYVTLIAPLLCACHVILTLRTADPRGPQLASILFLATCTAAYAHGASVGVKCERDRWESKRASVLAALTLPPQAVAMTYGPNLFPDWKMLVDSLESMRRTHFSAFASPSMVRELSRHMPAPMAPAISPMPLAVEASRLEPDRGFGTLGVLVHAPGQMTFELAPGTHALRASFGFRQGAYLVGHTDGAEFSVWIDDGDRRLLWQRSLHPLDSIADRGPQELALDIVVTKPSKLLMRTDPGPDGDDSFDWTVWGSIELTAVTAAPVLP